MIPPSQLQFYKGMKGDNGAIQFKLLRPHYAHKLNPKAFKNLEGKYILPHWDLKDSKGNKVELKAEDLILQDGAIFLDITSAKGRNEYDWENKIILALSIKDLGKILTVLEGLAKEVVIIHDPKANTPTAGKIQKYFKVSSPKGLSAGVILSATEKKQGENSSKSHMVPLSSDEVIILRECFKIAIGQLITWA